MQSNVFKDCAAARGNYLMAKNELAKDPNACASHMRKNNKMCVLRKPTLSLSILPRSGVHLRPYSKEFMQLHLRMYPCLPSQRDNRRTFQRSLLCYVGCIVRLQGGARLRSIGREPPASTRCFRSPANLRSFVRLLCCMKAWKSNKLGVCTNR